jgi:ammonia channel protein AmtB
MSIGTIVGIISSLLIGKLKSMLNKKGIIDSNGIIGSYLIPGLIAGILSAIFHAAKPPTYSSNYNPRSGIDSSMSYLKQGGMQLAGVFISIGCGILTGIISGFLMKIVNKR